MADIYSNSDHVLAKKKIRDDMKTALNVLCIEKTLECSDFVNDKVSLLPVFTNCSALSIYLSMPKEIITKKLLDKAFQLGKRVFIPKIIGKNPRDMVMIEIFSVQEIDNFPKNRWGIPEPPIELIQQRPDGATLGVIDLVILPGVAFDDRCGRVGHGKGYYGTFLYDSI